MPMLLRLPLPLLPRIGGQIFRVKQIHRLRAYLLPCALENTQPAINLGFARAQRYPQREHKAHNQVYHANQQHKNHALYKHPQAFMPRHRRIADVGRRKGNVANIQRQPQRVPHKARHAQQHAEAHVPHQAAVVGVEIIGHLAA